MKFETEREGQLAFFANYHIDPEIALADNNDGVWNGNILEFKLNINNLSAVLFQTVKYLSKRRIKGKEIPANILLIDLNKTTAYLYKSENYKEDIQQVYIGAASQNNEDFIAGEFELKLDYSNDADAIELKKILAQSDYMKIDIDEDCVVGWAERYYRENPKADKGDFIGDNDRYGKITKIGEIREPKHFAQFINPYTQETNEKFKYLMDKLNDRLRKKDLGAFYTPKLYAEKACELVKMAIDRVPEGNDYIILDRCAGTGSLEQAVYDVLGPEVASHIICSTYEYYEYKVLLDRVGGFVRTVIPPTEDNVVYQSGCIKNADAMSEEYVNNKVIKKYVDDEKCNIILFENPPYRDIASQDKVEVKNKPFVYEEFKKKGTDNAAHRDLANLFIWSGMQYYMTGEFDSYIVFSPAKYFKTLNFVNMSFKAGYAFNRRHFHATDSVITCALWINVTDEFKTGKIEAFDIEDGQLAQKTILTINKVKDTFVAYNDKRTFKEDETTIVNVNNSDGTESFKLTDKQSVYNPNIIGYMRATSFNLNANSRCLTRMPTYDALTQSYGFYLRSDNYHLKLPLWTAKLIPQDNWYDKDVYSTTSDGGDVYTKDQDFLKHCLIYTCLSNQNKCLSFHGSDGRDYQNELCLDAKALALKDMAENVKSGKWKLDEDEKELLKLWKKILDEAKEILKETSPKLFDEDGKYYWNLGVYQITKEVNTVTQDEKGKNVYDHPELNGDLIALRTKLKNYYKTHITGKMFEYELIK